MKIEMIYRRAPGKLQAGFALIALMLAAFILIKSTGQMSARIQITHGDKLLHIAAYFALGLFTYPALARLRPLWVWLLIVAFGLCIEVLQGTMGAGRTADMGDGLANAVGALAALLAWLVVSIMAVRLSPNRRRLNR